MDELRDFIYIDGEGVRYWPMCKTRGCPNRMNIAMGTGHCWPCNGTQKTLQEVIDALNEVRPLTVSGSDR